MPKFTDEYDGLARDLEDRAAIVPSPAISRDQDNAAITHRIRTALTPIFDSFAAVSSTKYITFSVQDADGIRVHAGRGTRSFPAWANRSGVTFFITRITASSDQDNYSFTLFKSASLADLSTGNDVQLAAITCSTDGTSHFTADISSFSSAAIETGKWLVWEHTSGTADVVTVTIEGFFSG